MKKFIITNLLLALIVSAALAQTKVKGRIVNERGKGVEYVTIGLENDSIGVISDSDGKFSITVPQGRKGNLVFMHVSYQTAVVPFSSYGSGEVEVVMKDKVVQLAEVVVGKKNKKITLSGKSWITVGDCVETGDLNSNKHSEIGPSFSNSKDCVLSDIQLGVKKCTFQSCTISFNVYKMDGEKFENILNRPIYLKISPADNGQKKTVSLSEYIRLKAKQKYYVSICIVDVEGSGIAAFPLCAKGAYVRNAIGWIKHVPVCPEIVVKGYEAE
ncbi:MAG: carboxypeptidase-like regulatory domain-containing protein [Bacteroidaceae bacterium]|nr:carboxypeptidase-like regulatory domain-containing protein [Bacteroidaceae bacterium]